MTYRPLGDSGLLVSAVGIGCNAFSRRVDQAGVAEILAAARDSGVTLLDTADVYGVTHGASEEMLGAALTGQRDEFVIATKFGGGLVAREHGPGGSRHYVMDAVEGSLRRLRTDHIDLYQLHVPDDVTPIEETLSALTELVQAGKVRYVGCSNFAAWQIADADRTARTAGLERFVSAQNGYSLLDRSVEDEVIPACGELGSGCCRTTRSRTACSPASTAAASRRRRDRVRRWTPIVPGGCVTRTGTPSRRSRRTPRSATSRCSTSRSAVWRPSRPSRR